MDYWSVRSFVIVLIGRKEEKKGIVTTNYARSMIGGGGGVVLMLGGCSRYSGKKERKEGKRSLWNNSFTHSPCTGGLFVYLFPQSAECVCL